MTINKFCCLIICSIIAFTASLTKLYGREVGQTDIYRNADKLEGIKISTDSKIVWEEKIKLKDDKGEILVILIKKPRDDFDYSEINIFKYNPIADQYELIFRKDNFDGVKIGECRCLLKNIITQNAGRYFITPNINTKVDLIFIFPEYPYGSTYTGDVTILGLKNNKVNNMFSKTASIQWENLDNDNIPEVLTSGIIESGWAKEEFQKPFLNHDVYKYEDKNRKYTLDNQLTKKRLEKELPEIIEAFNKTYTESELKYLLLYYLKLGKAKDALKMFDESISKVTFPAGWELSTAKRGEIRKCIIKYIKDR